MVFYADKCKVIHFRHGNKNFSHEMCDVLLEYVDEWRDIKVIV